MIFFLNSYFIKMRERLIKVCNLIISTTGISRLLGITGNQEEQMTRHVETALELRGVRVLA